MSFAFRSRRSNIFGTKGMVSASQPAAVNAGLKILNKGGNAADAAVATAAVLNLTEPSSCGIGGDVFCLFWKASDGSLKGLNGSGRSPAALDLEKARELGIKGSGIPTRNINSVTVPGSPQAWIDTLSLFGSRKLTLKDVLEPAITLANDGVPIGELTSNAWNRSVSLIFKASPNGPELLIPKSPNETPKDQDGYRGPNPAEIWINKNLAQTFTDLTEKGRDGFYGGRIANEIVDVIKSQGGVMELSDLASHKSTPTEAISYTYRNTPYIPPTASLPSTYPDPASGNIEPIDEPITLHEHAPNGQGLTALIALGILDELQDIGKIPKGFVDVEHNGVTWLHALIESMRLAFADSRAYIGDPEKVYVPVKELLSRDYLRSRALLFDPKKATADIKKGSPVKSSDTVYFTTADSEGNACSYIMSNYTGFGNGAIPKGTGFTLQNRGSNFTLEEGHPNQLEGGKRPYHTIIPAMVTKGKDLFMAFGVMGGFMQPQGHVQVLLNMLHRRLDPQAALDAPRFCISDDPNGKVYLEEGIGPEIVVKLKAMGHDVESVTGHERQLFGRGQIILRTVDERTGRRVWAAGSDPRADGCAQPQL